MDNVTQQMIKIYKIKTIDFMGYKIEREKELSFHHLIIPHRNCKKYGLGDGRFIWNGAILVQDTSHNYLNLIEQYDFELFCRITSEMIDENLKGKIDIYNLRNINDLLTYFEKEYANYKSSKGKILIKSEYITKRNNKE